MSTRANGKRKRSRRAAAAEREDGEDDMPLAKYKAFAKRHTTGEGGTQGGGGQTSGQVSGHHTTTTTTRHRQPGTTSSERSPPHTSPHHHTSAVRTTQSAPTDGAPNTSMDVTPEVKSPEVSGSRSVEVVAVVEGGEGSTTEGAPLPAPPAAPEGAPHDTSCINLMQTEELKVSSAPGRLTAAESVLCTVSPSDSNLRGPRARDSYRNRKSFEVEPEAGSSVTRPQSSAATHGPVAASPWLYVPVTEPHLDSDVGPPLPEGPPDDPRGRDRRHELPAAVQNNPRAFLHTVLHHANSCSCM